MWPDEHPDALSRVQAHWDLSGPFPVPRFTPVCSQDAPHPTVIRGCIFHQRSGGYRCDVMFKCVDCSNTIAFGVVIDKEMWHRATTAKFIPGKFHNWRDMKEAYLAHLHASDP